MIRPLSALGEYFLGTETIQLCQYERKVLREFSTDKNEYKVMSRFLWAEELAYLSFGKIGPNIFSAHEILNPINPEHPYLFLGMSEVSRLVWIGANEIVHYLARKKYISRVLKQSCFEQRKEEIDDEIKTNEEEGKRLKEEIERLEKELDEGDEWKES